MIKKDNDKLNLYSLMVFNEGAYLYKKGQNEIQEKDVINLFSAVKKNEKDIKVEIYRHKELIKGAKYSEEAMCSLLCNKKLEIQQNR